MCMILQWKIDCTDEYHKIITNEEILWYKSIQVIWCDCHQILIYLNNSNLQSRWKELFRNYKPSTHCLQFVFKSSFEVFPWRPTCMEQIKLLHNMQRNRLIEMCTICLQMIIYSHPFHMDFVFLTLIKI
jgi:hypothetical protein